MLLILKKLANIFEIEVYELFKCKKTQKTRQKKQFTALRRENL